MTLQQPASQETSLVLVTGATGYIGGRLVPILEGAGVRLRCLARHPNVPTVGDTLDFWRVERTSRDDD